MKPALTGRSAPPGAEKTDRYSVVFFTRANDEIELRALADQSTQIAAAVTEIPNAQARFWPGVTAREWLERRVRNQRLKNFKVCLWINRGLHAHSCAT